MEPILVNGINSSYLFKAEICATLNSHCTISLLQIIIITIAISLQDERVHIHHSLFSSENNPSKLSISGVYSFLLKLSDGYFTQNEAQTASHVLESPCLQHYFLTLILNFRPRKTLRNLTSCRHWPSLSHVPSQKMLQCSAPFPSHHQGPTDSLRSPLIY